MVRRGKPRLYGSAGTPILGFLCWPQQDFAGERLRSLRHEHGYSVGYVRGLQHLLGIFSWMRAEIGVNRPRANDRDANVVGSRFFRHRVAQSILAPLLGV